MQKVIYVFYILIMFLLFNISHWICILFCWKCLSWTWELISSLSQRF